MSQEIIRKELLALLRGGNAHMTLEQAVADFPSDEINAPFPNGDYGAWAVLEHLRRTQWDILEFIRNKDYHQPEWPRGYWPESGQQASAADWQATLDGFERDMKDLEAVVQDPQTDLYAKIPWGDGQTIFREILLVADHNAHHLGEFAIMRQVMATWGAHKPS